MNKLNKLELKWVGKLDKTNIEPRVLVLDKKKSIQPENNENVLIKGDNLISLHSIKNKFENKIKCIFIDPPYNTGSAFEQYEDGLEHSIWLNLMRDRLIVLRELLNEDGSLWISIDDNESHYLKILCDEIFGRKNFVSNVIWQKKHTRSNDAKFLSDNHDHILCYAKNKSRWKRNLLPRDENSDDNYKNVDNDPRGPWASGPCHAKTPNQKDIYEITSSTGVKFNPPPGTSWRFNKQKFQELIKDNRIYFGKTGKNVPRFKRFKSEVQDGLVPTTIWTHKEVGHNQDAKSEVKRFNEKEVFATPKPEKLIERILQISTMPGDYVLDSFAGSGTTGAVAHKMKRKWIMIEIGNHCDTHIIPRLKKVIEGDDRNEISLRNNWEKGGGYKYYNLSESLLKKDSFGQYIINDNLNEQTIKESICMMMGYDFLNSKADQYWQDGKSTETDYIYILNSTVSEKQLEKISINVGENSLILCCKAFNGDVDKFRNLTIKKIPDIIVDRYEWDKTNYNLNVT